jgi:hypothetical protein
MIKVNFSGYQVFPNLEITNKGVFSDKFLQIGMKTFHDACKWVNDLPYDYNSDVVDSKLIFTEKKGVCLTKHGSVARLAEELGLPVTKNIGLFRLSDEFYSGIEKLLERYGLKYIPHIDCFLQYKDHCVDLTDGNCTGKNKPIDEFDFIIPIPPEISMDEMIVLYMQYIDKYAEFDPVFKTVGIEKILTALSECTNEMQARCCVVNV